MKNNDLVGRSILIVEDEALIALDLANACEDAGASVHTVRDPESANLLIDNRQICGAIVDFGFGPGNARSLCERLAIINLPYVIHSGYSSIDDAYSRCVVVPKPADPRTVVDALAALLTKAS